MTPTEPCLFTKDRETQCLDPHSQPPVPPTEAMVRQAEIDAAYLALEAARADPLYQPDLRAKAAEARERAHRLRSAMAGLRPYEEAGRSPGHVGEFESAPKALA
jgi:hypothetical protein